VKTRAWLSLSFAAVLMSSAAVQPLRFALAIGRFDGHVVPFAAYHGGRWERAWPEANEASDPLPALDDLPSVWRRHGEPVPREWHVWPVSGAEPIPAHIDGIEVTDAHCVDQIALKTDLRATKGSTRLSLA
jgi:hypothetical protein